MRIFMQMDSAGGPNVTPEVSAVNPAYFITTDVDGDGNNYQFWLIPDNGTAFENGLLPLQDVKDAVLTFLDGASFSIITTTTYTGAEFTQAEN